MKITLFPILPFTGIVVFLAFLYWPGLHGGFFFDDASNILDSDEVRMSELSWSALEAAWGSGHAGPLGRPVSMLSFALNYYFSGFQPFAFKLTNLLIHLVNSLLVYSLARLLGKALDGKTGDAHTHRFAFLVALIWAAHPIQLTSILYVVQRMTSLSSLFILIGLVLHIWARQTIPINKQGYFSILIAWCLAFPLSLLSKETGILFIGYIFAYELLIRRHYNSGYDKFAIWYLSLVAFVVSSLTIYLLFFSSWLWAGYIARPFTLQERLLTESRIVWEYILLTLLPSLPRFALFHDDVAISKGLFTPLTTLFSVFGLLGLIILAYLQRFKNPLISLAIVWFIIGHSLESSLVPLELMHEHRNYLPSLGLVFLLMHIVRSSVFKTEKRSFLLRVVGFALLAYFSVLTFLRADMYGDDIRRTQIEAQYHERSVRSQFEAGALLLNMYHKSPTPELLRLSNKHFEQANLIDPTFKIALIGMLQLDCLSGNEARVDIYNELNRRLAFGVIAVHERTAMAHIVEAQNSGVLCLSREQVDSLFFSILSNKFSQNSDKSKILNRYAMYLWLGQKDYPAAMEALDSAFGYADIDPSNRLNAIQLSRVMGNKEEILKRLAYFDGRKLDDISHARLLEIRKELIRDGVLDK